MENKKLNEKESLELISQMIQNTRTRVEKDGGTPFLIWGYGTVIISLLVWYMVTSTGKYEWQYLWFLLPAIGFPGTLWVSRKNESAVKTYIDRVVNYIWIVFGSAGFLVSCVSIVYPLPILFIILLLMGMGVILTGMVIHSKIALIGGLLGVLSSLGCIWVTGVNQILAFAPAFIFMMIIPGHMINYSANIRK
ncbi:hypothetical protein [Bacteroides sp.]|uniref:hypothetical protein n=1 Tax=Bacteroides sp. TaxID=29523 RepID=UPI0025C16BCB|nr:hypothetical protein [Bacteroides sp.]